MRPPHPSPTSILTDSAPDSPPPAAATHEAASPVPCERCGQPGTLRHFPGPSPTSGVWCDRHYRQLLWLHPSGHYGRILWRVVLVAAVAAYGFWRTRHR